MFLLYWHSHTFRLFGYVSAILAFTHIETYWICFCYTGIHTYLDLLDMFLLYWHSHTFRLIGYVSAILAFTHI